MEYNMESIEKVIISIGGFFGGTDSYTIEFNERGLATIKKEGLKYDGSGEYCITMRKTDSTKLLSKIKAWGVPNWKSEYMSSDIVFDGEQWELTYKEEGQEILKFDGSNAYPPTWDKVLATLAWLDFLDREMKSTYGYITKVIITFKAVIKHINTNRCEASPSDYFLIEDTQEIRINRNHQTIRTKNTMGEMTFESNFSVPEGVSEILNEMSEIVEFNNWRAFVAEEYDENNYCDVELYFTKSEPVRFRATYVPEKMPYGWYDFSNTYNDFVKFYPSPAVISNKEFWHRFEEGMLIYCSCMFDQSGNTYYYRTEDRTIEEGDEVVVPVGADNREEVVIVDAVDYYKPEDVPFPIEKTKMIIRKVEDDD
jgi:hypothetical protein